jgi:hypothetical protein
MRHNETFSEDTSSKRKRVSHCVDTRLPSVMLVGAAIHRLPKKSVGNFRLSRFNDFKRVCVETL